MCWQWVEQTQSYAKLSVYHKSIKTKYVLIKALCNQYHVHNWYIKFSYMYPWVHIALWVFWGVNQYDKGDPHSLWTVYLWTFTLIVDGGVGEGYVTHYMTWVLSISQYVSQVMNAMHWHRRVLEIPLIGLWCWFPPSTQLSFAVNVVKTKWTSYGELPKPATRRSISITTQPETDS